jgi:hypothetical protein
MGMSWKNTPHIPQTPQRMHGWWLKDNRAAFNQALKEDRVEIG